MPEVCGPGGIPGDPEAIREAAGLLETNSSLNADIASDIRTAAMTVLSGWSAPSAQGFEAFATQASAAADALLELGPRAAKPLLEYADLLEAAQAALMANQAAAQAIEALLGELPAVPVGPGSPAAAPAPPPPEEDKPWWSDAGHLVLDGIGLVPGFGEPADGINALWYLAEGDKLNAGLSATGMAPFLGWGATGTKWGIKGARAGAKGADAIRLPPGQSFGNPAKLEDHFQRHGADFGASSADDYADQASDFLQTSQRDGLPTRIDADGVIRVHDPSTNTFGAFNSDGTTRTFFKPTSPTYFDGQPGSPPQP